MLFCSNCQNMLIVEKHNSNNYLTCKSCPFHLEILKKVILKQKNTVKKVDSVFGGQNELKYASTCTKKCIKCESNTALFMEIQTRSADEPMTLFYQCVECRITWKE
ncbi:DNA-directed RNA polymerase III subunit RPC10 [Binucleata daphniae]